MSASHADRRKEKSMLTTYMAFQNDSGAGYVINEPAVPYKQLSQMGQALGTRYN
jgi:hypothetical protein